MHSLNLRPANEEVFSVTIVDQYSQPNIESQDEVDFVTLNLMLQADYVTVRGTTIKKSSTRVDEKGNVFFYGTIRDIDSL